MYKLGEVITEILNQYGLTVNVQAQRAINCWEKVVGPYVAKHCQAVEVKGNILVIRTRNAAWRNEIALQQDSILKELNEELGFRKIMNIRFRS